MRKKTKKQLLGGLIATVCICAAIGAAFYFWPKTASTLPPGSGGTFTIVDPFNRDVVMDPRDFTLTVMKHEEGTTTTSAANWDADADVTDTRDLTPAFFAAERAAGYDAFYGIISGAVVNDEYTYDDIYGDRTYGSRQFPISEAGGIIYVYVTPSGAAGFTIKNLNTGAAITTANITTAINFSVTMFLNNASAGAYDQAYVSYVNYIGTEVDVNVVATYTNKTGGTGATILTTDMTASGMTVTSPAYNKLAFHCDYLGQSPVTNVYEWDSVSTALDYARIVSPNSVGLVQNFGLVAI